MTAGGPIGRKRLRPHCVLAPESTNWGIASRTVLIMHPTLPLLQNSDFPPLRRGALETLQVNLGYRCNQQCLHCHVNAGPTRREVMSRETVDEVLAFLGHRSDAHRIRRLDLTGGAPELNPHFRALAAAATELGVEVIDRCNLTILQEPGQHDLARFLAAHRVQVVASLPCYQSGNVDGQRGKGVFERSIAALRELNQLGYGHGDTGLQLNLVYNPTGPSLPPPQADLERDFKQRLEEDHGVVFDALFTIANMPIARFGSTLISKGTFVSYMDLLKSAYNPATLPDVMCRGLISVDWQGRVYDCDFNQMLDLPLNDAGSERPRLADLMAVAWPGRAVVVRDHCYGCTAGQGSSCGGALEATLATAAAATA